MSNAIIEIRKYHLLSESHKIKKKIFIITIMGNPKIKKIGSMNLTGLKIEPNNDAKMDIANNTFVKRRILYTTDFFDMF